MKKTCPQNVSLLIALVSLTLIVGFVALSTYLIMLIWNKVLVVKLTTAKLQPLDFWEALALAVFVNLLLIGNVSPAVLLGSLNYGMLST